jgi:hypothetical protein
VGGQFSSWHVGQGVVVVGAGVVVVGSGVVVVGAGVVVVGSGVVVVGSGVVVVGSGVVVVGSGVVVVGAGVVVVVGQYKVLRALTPSKVMGHCALAMKFGTVPAYPKYCWSNPSRVPCVHPLSGSHQAPGQFPMQSLAWHTSTKLPHISSLHRLALQFVES